MKKVLFLATGGAIVSSSSEEDLVPSLTNEKVLHYLGEYHGDIEITCEDLLRLDSSSMQPEGWQLIARRIAEAESGYDGTVLNHGTDMMAYTAGALSFMPRSLDVPLIMAGSRLPPPHPLSDGVENIRVAFTTVCEDIQGVYVCSNREVMLATHVVKVRTMNFGALESINIESCRRVDAGGLRINGQLLIHPANAFTLEDKPCKEAVSIKLIPGMNPLLFDKLAEMDIRGIVIEAFSVSGVNFAHRSLISKLEEIVARGVSMIIYNQCLYEYSDFSIYQTGQKVLQHGVIQGYDMTSEACTIKLMQALEKSTDAKEVKRVSETNYINEVTLPQACVLFCLRIHVKQKLLSTDDPQLVEDFCFLMPGRQHESRGWPFILLLSV